MTSTSPAPSGESEATIWLIYSREHNAFWRPDSSGYTHDIAAAGRYTKHDADSRCRVRRHDDGGPGEVAVLAPEVALASNRTEGGEPVAPTDEEREDAKAMGYYEGRADVYALLAKGFDVVDDDENIVGRVTYEYEKGDSSVGIPDSELFFFKPAAPPPPEAKALDGKGEVVVWHLGSMNDGLFIIDRPPSPAGTDNPPHNEYGPTLVLNVTELPAQKAKAIVEAHNASLRHPPEPGAGKIREALERITALRPFPFTDEGGTVLNAADVTEIASAALAVSPEPREPKPFQARVADWMAACFGPEISADKVERNHRFIEEALELVQACGCTKSEAHQLVDYVFDRPQGDVNQEVGGVMVTLAALCLANGFDMHGAGETELARVWTKIDKIRAKQAAKPRHSPLPEQPAAPTDEVRRLREGRLAGLEEAYEIMRTKSGAKVRFIEEAIADAKAALAPVQEGK